MEKQIKYYKAENESDFEKCKDIIVEYLDTLGIDLAYMNLENEFSEMKQMYGGIQGIFFYALDENEVIGCVGANSGYIDHPIPI